jgi:hypothetical protein
MQDEDKIFGLITQAEDIQAHAVKLQKVAQDVVRTLPEATRNAVRDATREIIVEGAEKASRGLLDASRGAEKAAGELRAAHSSALLKHIGFLCLMAVLLSVTIYAGLGFFANRRAAELDELSAQVSVHRATLAELQSQTWGVELVNFRDGSRGIALSKGEFERIAELQDGRSVVILK